MKFKGLLVYDFSKESSLVFLEKIPEHVEAAYLNGIQELSRGDTIIIPRKYYFVVKMNSIYECEIEFKQIGRGECLEEYFEVSELKLRKENE